LDARVEKPWERDLKQFSHPDLRGWAKTNRSKILGAFLTIGRYWFAKGQPVPQDAVSLGSFESWSRVMSGVLHAAGIEGFLGNRDQLYEKTTDSTGLWSTFVAAWHEAFADKKFTAAELAGELKLPGNQALREALPEDLSPNDENLARKLGNHFKKQQGVRYGRLYIDKRGEKKRSALWMVVDGGDDRGDGNQIRLIDLAGGSESDGGGESGESGESAGASSARAGARARTPADVRARTEAAHVDSPESSDSLQKEAQASTNRRGEVSKSSESSPTPEQEAEYASPPAALMTFPRPPSAA